MQATSSDISPSPSAWTRRAATPVLLAGSPLLEKIGGRYFEDGNEADSLLRRPGDYRGVARYALDPGNAARLWDMTLEMIDRRQRR